MSSATNTRTGDPTRQVGVSEGGTRKPGTKSNIGAGTRMCGQTHVCVAVRNNLALVFVLVPGVNFLLNIFPSC